MDCWILLGTKTGTTPYHSDQPFCGFIGSIYSRFPTVVALNIYNWLNEPHLSDTFNLSYRSYNPINPIYVKGHNSTYIPTFFCWYIIYR
jgi:membrane peptidoglycan carboxypeptidase